MKVLQMTALLVQRPSKMFSHQYLPKLLAEIKLSEKKIPKYTAENLKRASFLFHPGHENKNREALLSQHLSMLYELHSMLPSQGCQIFGSFDVTRAVRQKKLRRSEPYLSC